MTTLGDVLTRYDELAALLTSIAERPVSDDDQARRAAAVLHREARLLDAGRLDGWLSTFTDDAVLWVPLAPHAHPGTDQSWYLDDRRRLAERVAWHADPTAWGQHLRRPPCGTSARSRRGPRPALDAFLKYNDIEKSRVEFILSQYDPAVLTADQADSIFCFYNDLPVALEVKGIAHNSMLLADFGYNPASQVYTVLTASLEGDTREQVKHLLRAEIRGWQDYKIDYAEAAQLAVDQCPDAGLDLNTQQDQAKVQLDIMYSDVTDTDGFAWFTDELVTDNMKLFTDLGITGATPELFDRSLLEEIFADGPTIT